MAFTQKENILLWDNVNSFSAGLVYTETETLDHTFCHPNVVFQHKWFIQRFILHS